VIRLLWSEETYAVCRNVVWQVKRQRQMTRVTECIDNVCLYINLLCFIGVFAALRHPDLYRTAGGILISELYYLLWQLPSCNDVPLFYLKLMHDSFMAWYIQNKEYIEISLIMKSNNGFYPSYRQGIFSSPGEIILVSVVMVKYGVLFEVRTEFLNNI
jgi:hypothetical protein